LLDVAAGKRQVVEEDGRACHELGFLTVVGHRIDEQLVEQTSAATRAFFDLPAEEKLALASGEPTAGLPAYRPLRSESLAASLGHATPGDLKESLDWGPAVPGFG
jgi:isopenicillin N synthase-like dioxygenase